MSMKLRLSRVIKDRLTSKAFHIFFLLLFIVITETVFLIKNWQIENTKGFKYSEMLLRTCQTINDTSQKLQCWENLIDSTLKAEGVDRAFEVIKNFYAAEPDLVGDCHGYTHKIGDEAFKLFFARHKDQALSSKSFFCGFGFYHGFMDTMLHTTGTLDEAREFCKYAGEKLAQQNNDAEGTCYHGIGHGVVDGNDPRSEGKAEEIIKPGLELCKKVAPSEKLLDRCSSGVFNSLAIMLNSNQHKLSIDKKNPLWICQKQSNPIFQLTCYQEMNTVLLKLEAGNFTKAAQWIKKIPEEEIATSAMESLGQIAASLYKKGSDYSGYINTCQEFQSQLRLACIRGFSVGIILFGIPGEEYLEALKFCQSKLMTETEQDGCLERLTWGLYITYPTEKFKSICKNLDDKYIKYCSRFFEN